jgi:hypothetical protein
MTEIQKGSTKTAARNMGGFYCAVLVVSDYFCRMKRFYLTFFCLTLCVLFIACGAKEKKDEDKVPEKTKQEELKDTTRLDSANTDGQ